MGRSSEEMMNFSARAYQRAQKIIDNVMKDGGS